MLTAGVKSLVIRASKSNMHTPPWYFLVIYKSLNGLRNNWQNSLIMFNPILINMAAKNTSNKNPPIAVAILGRKGCKII